MKKLYFAISPCPNDTYIFGALLKGFIDTPFEIDFILRDVEELNKLAIKGHFDVIKVSVAMYPKVRDKYVLLSSGGAMGRGCGPIIVSRQGLNINDLMGLRVGIPGKNTTAYLLFTKAVPDFKGEILEIKYNEIIPSLLKGDIDVGILIHEARFTYKEYGLNLVMDLGQWWEEETDLPIPLGCILAKNDLGNKMHIKIESLIRNSIKYADNNLEKIWPFIKENAQEMEDEVILSHIKTFVNEFSIDIGIQGNRAIDVLL